jgi:hypothetical protein
MSERERVLAEEYMRRNRSMGAGISDAVYRAAERAGRIVNQAFKSPIQAGKQFALSVADPEVAARDAGAVVDAELKLLDQVGLADYLETAADRTTRRVAEIAQSPEAAGNMLATGGIARLTRGAAFQGTNLDEAALATKAASDAALERYSEEPEPWSSVLNLDELIADYAEAKHRARGSDRALAPVWGLTDSVDQKLASAEDVRQRMDREAREAPRAAAPTVSDSGNADYGNRPDGSKKGKGWLGGVFLDDGSVATEFSTQSDAVTVNGKRIDFPTLVPTLTPEELRTMKQVIATNGEIPEGVMQKAIQHARKRLSENKSVFADG